ncbi:MAG: hypothetical protein JXR77_14195 [Lentisphaeria bacterium]|nr:hypothetical protein [Lentisphaeria bacterium]
MQSARYVEAVFLVLLAVAAAAMGQEARWVITNRWEGMGSQQTEIFWVNGSDWRVRYRPKGKGIFQIAVYDQASDLIDLAASQTRSSLTSGSADLHGRGARYLAITGVDSSWEVTVEQHVTTIEEWHLTQLLKQARPRLLKVGIWTGEAGAAEYTFHVPADHWQIRHGHSGDGLLQIVVEDADGFVALAANEITAKTGSSWVHKAGTFTLRIRAENIAWTVEVLAEDTGGGG